MDPLNATATIDWRTAAIDRAMNGSPTSSSTLPDEKEAPIRKFTELESSEVKHPTPKKAKLMRRTLSEADVGYDLTRREVQALGDGVSALKEMPLNCKAKQAELVGEFAKTIMDKAAGPFDGSKQESPRRQAVMARELRGSWASPELSKLSDVAPREVPSPPLAIDHLTKFDGKGLHLCDPSSKHWGSLRNITRNTETGVYVATITGPVPKYSTFWPLGVTDRQLVSMNEGVEPVLRNGNKEIIRIEDPNTSLMIYGMRYHQGYTISSFFPFLALNSAEGATPEARVTLNLEMDGPPRVRIEIAATHRELIDFAKGVVKKEEGIDFTDRSEGTIFIDATSFFHLKGLPTSLSKGVMIKFNAREVGYKFLSVFSSKKVGRVLNLDGAMEGESKRGDLFGELYKLSTACMVPNLEGCDIAFND